MGFWVNGKWVDEADSYYDWQAVRERNDQWNKAADDRRRAEKARRKAQAKRRAEKKRIRDEQYKESQEYMKQIEQQYGSAGNPGPQGTGGDGDPAALYKKFTPDNKGAYQEEIARRYGYLYHSSNPQDNAPGLDRGLGAGHHQGIKRTQKYASQPQLGPIGKPIKIPLALGGGSDGQHNPQTARAVGKKSGGGGRGGTSGGGFGGCSGGGGLRRPL